MNFAGGCANAMPKTKSPDLMSDLTAKIQAAATGGQLLESSAKNLLAFLAKTSSPVSQASIAELVEADNWKELDNRFFRTLAFGTGGLRGKTISTVVDQSRKRHSASSWAPRIPVRGHQRDELL